MGDLEPPAPLIPPVTSLHPALSWPPPLSPGTWSQCHSGCLPRMSLGTSRSPRPQMTLASSPDLLLLPVFLSGMAPPSSVIGTDRPRPHPRCSLPSPAHCTLWCLPPKYSFHRCFSLPPCAPCPGPGTPCSLSGFTSQLLPGLCPPPWCSELRWLPSALRRKPRSSPWPMCPSLMGHPFLLELSAPVILSHLHSLHPAYPHCFPLLCFIVCPTTSPPGRPPGPSGWVRCVPGSPFPALSLLGSHCQRDRFVSQTGLYVLGRQGQGCCGHHRFPGTVQPRVGHRAGA